MIKEMFRNIKATNKPMDIIKELKEQFWFISRLQEGLKGKTIAKEMVLRKFCDAYKELPKYLYLLKRTNPRSFVQLKTNTIICSIEEKQ